METKDYGYVPGETCYRYSYKGLQCYGRIKEHPSEQGCSCHTGNPPCSNCVDSRAYCPDCGWDGREEQMQSDIPTLNINHFKFC